MIENALLVRKEHAACVPVLSHKSKEAEYTAHPKRKANTAPTDAVSPSVRPMEEVNAWRRPLRKMQRQQVRSREAYTATALPWTRMSDSNGKMILSDIDSHTKLGRQLGRGTQIRDRLYAFRCSNGAAYPACSSPGTSRPPDGGPSLTILSRYMNTSRTFQATVIRRVSGIPAGPVYWTMSQSLRLAFVVAIKPVGLGLQLRTIKLDSSYILSCTQK